MAAVGGDRRPGKDGAFPRGAGEAGAWARARADCVAIGNILVDDGVPAAMVAAFLRNPAAPLAERLLDALQAGEDAGGEHGPVLSAVIEVHGTHDFPLVDLRVDRAEEPIGVLSALYRDYAPSIEEFVLRATDPDRARGG
ncbi:DUF1028 domain-containing protein [Roseomonas sp. CCTCC AB2023176]|uniref:DUF1028 domain-containing protein n=1 Tax=Roseomonas sp. CCTCC AB2023176 TaxID=3342640 RepID=UPI0035D80ABF